MSLDDNKSRRAKRRWVPAVEADGEPRDGAEVADLTELVNLDTWPEGTRLIVRRERAHPGAQLSLFDDIEGRRHTAFITNQTGDAPPSSWTTSNAAPLKTSSATSKPAATPPGRARTS